MDIDELKQGDVLLFSPEKGSFISWAITFLTNSNVSHAAMFFNEEDKTIIEETPPQIAVNSSLSSIAIFIALLKNITLRTVAKYMALHFAKQNS